MRSAGRFIHNSLMLSSFLLIMIDVFWGAQLGVRVVFFLGEA